MKQFALLALIMLGSIPGVASAQYPAALQRTQMAALQQQQALMVRQQMAYYGGYGYGGYGYYPYGYGYGIGYWGPYGLPYSPQQLGLLQQQQYQATLQNQFLGQMQYQNAAMMMMMPHHHHRGW